MQTEYNPLLYKIGAFVFHACKIRNRILYDKWYCIAVPPHVVYVLPLYTRQDIDAFGRNWILSLVRDNTDIPTASMTLLFVLFI